MVKTKELIKFLEAINEDTIIAVTIKNSEEFTCAKVVEVTYNSKENVLMIVGEGEWV